MEIISLLEKNKDLFGEVDFDLLLQSITAEVWGLYYKESILYCSRGESLTCKRHEILEVRALRKVPSKFNIILSKINMDYSTIAFASNNPLPSCLSYKIMGNILRITGVPGSNQSEEEYKI